MSYSCAGKTFFLVVFEADVAVVDGVQDVLRPRDEQPYDGHVLLRDGLHDPLRTDAFQKHGTAARDEGAEPVHLRARVIEGRHAEEDVVMCLRVVLLLRECCAHERLVTVQDGFGEARRAAGEIYRGIVLVRDLDIGAPCGSGGDELVIALRKGGAILAHKEHAFDLVQLSEDGLHSPDELLAEHKHADVRKVEAVFDLVCGISVIEGDGETARFQDAEIDGQPFQTVHEQHAHLLSPSEPVGEEKIGEFVRKSVELLPRHLSAVLLVRGDLDEGVVLPRELMFLFELGVDLDKTGLVAVELRIPFQKPCDRHIFSVLLHRRGAAPRCGHFLSNL